MKSQWLQAVIHKSVLLSFLLYLIPKQDALQKSIMHATWSEEAGNTNLFTHSTHVGGGGWGVSTQRTLTRKTEHSCRVLLFMKHGSERETACMLVRMRVVSLRAFTLQAVLVFLLLGAEASSTDGPG